MLSSFVLAKRSLPRWSISTPKAESAFGHNAVKQKLEHQLDSNAMQLVLPATSCVTARAQRASGAMNWHKGCGAGLLQAQWFAAHVSWEPLGCMLARTPSTLTAVSYSYQRKLC